MEEKANKAEVLRVGGLEVPSQITLSSFALLYIGKDTSRQFLNIALRMVSISPESEDSGPPHTYWTYDPDTDRFSTNLSLSFQRRLNRRFYLVQKARMCSVFGVLVTNLSDPKMRSVMQTVLDTLRRNDRTTPWWW